MYLRVLAAVCLLITLSLTTKAEKSKQPASNTRDHLCACKERAVRIQVNDMVRARQFVSFFFNLCNGKRFYMILNTFFETCGLKFVYLDNKFMDSRVHSRKI